MNKPITPYVTSNNGKFQEVSQLLKDHPHLDCKITQSHLETTEIQSDDQEEITHRKALEAWDLLKTPLLVEDAGIFFEQYHNFPGTFSKWVFKSLGFEGLCKLYRPGDRAQFQVTLCYIESPASLHFFKGTSSGTLIAPKPGYNPQLPYSVIFVPDGYTQSYQELSDAGEVRAISPRKKAFLAFAEWLSAKK